MKCCKTTSNRSIDLHLLPLLPVDDPKREPELAYHQTSVPFLLVHLRNGFLQTTRLGRTAARRFSNSRQRTANPSEQFRKAYLHEIRQLLVHDVEIAVAVHLIHARFPVVVDDGRKQLVEFRQPLRVGFNRVIRAVLIARALQHPGPHHLLGSMEMQHGFYVPSLVAF